MSLDRFTEKIRRGWFSSLPPNAELSDLIVVNNELYASTINGCGGVANGLWAMDLGNDARPVVWWKNAASPVGAPAFSSTGTVFVAIGDGPSAGGGYADAIVALDPKTLQVKDSFTSPGASFTSTPTIFRYKDREILAAATKDGRVFLLDTASLKNKLFVSPATTTVRGFAPSALATWEDATQARWLAVPAAATKSGIVAYRVTGDGAKPSLQQAWVTRDLGTPSAPIVVNGVVFALSTGEYVPATGTANTAEKIAKSVPAVLYAFDGETEQRTLEPAEKP